MAVVCVENSFGADAAVETTDHHGMGILRIGNLFGVQRTKTFADGIAVKKIAVSGEQPAHTFIGRIIHNYIVAI